MSRRDLASKLFAIARGDSPLSVVTYSTSEDRDDVETELREIGQVVGVSFGRVTHLDDVFASPDRALIYQPPAASQVALVKRLEGERDRFAGRTAPLVLFLLQGGDAMRFLSREAPALMGWLRTALIDPAEMRRVDEVEESEAFNERTGCSPTEFVARVDAGEMPDTGETMHDYVLARALTTSKDRT